MANLARRLPALPLAATLLILALKCGGYSPAHAASFTVDSTVDAVDANPGDGLCADASGACTLRAAIMETNALPGADRIALQAETYTLSIPGRDEELGETGDLDTGGSLTITGAGSASTIISGGGLDRVFDAKGDLTLSGLTIRNGNAFGPAAEEGGGIVSVSSLSLTGVVVTANTAHKGGGILTVGSSFVMDSRVIGNVVSGVGGGGGIYNYGAMTLTNSQ